MQSFKIEKFKTLTGHRGAVYALAPGITTDTFYSSGNDGIIVEWKLNGDENGTMLAKVSNSVYSIMTIKEPGYIVAGHNYDGIHIIDVKKRKEVISLNLTDSQIFDIKSHKGSLYIATGKGEIVIVDLKAFKILSRLSFSSKSVRTLEILGEYLIAGYSDNSIRIIDLNNLKLKQSWEAHTNSVFSLRGSPSGEYFVSGSRDAHLKIWQAGPEFTLKESIVAHMYTINTVEFHPSGTHFLTGSMDKTIKLWDASQFKLLKVIDKERFGGHMSSVNRLVWSNYKNRVISCSDDRTISLWDIEIM
jgi:WD40 repeat protein